jgi:hypothetical protein
MNRHELEQFCGWTLVAVSGGIDLDDGEPENVRFCLREPVTGRLVDVYVTPEARVDVATWLEFDALPRTCLEHR